MNNFTRLLLTLALFAVALFCVYGFLTTFEPGPAVTVWTLRTLYAVIGLVSLLGGVRAVLPKRRQKR